jgi:hypothetical protein
LYAAYGGFVDETNAGSVFAYWGSLIPVHAVRLTLTLRQTAYSGLTSLIVIIEAKKLHPAFPWKSILRLLLDEVSCFMYACELVGSNPYYGYKKDMGQAASSYYRSLTWVCKELLIQVSGQAGLKLYAGWIKVPRYSAALKDLLEKYIASLEVDSNVALTEEQQGAFAAIEMLGCTPATNTGSGCKEAMMEPTQAVDARKP